MHNQFLYRKIRASSQHGYLIVYSMVLMFALMTIGVVSLSVVGTSYKFTKDDVYRKNAAQMAKACSSVIGEKLDTNPSFTTFSPSPQVLYDQTSSGGSKATCTVNSITNGTNNTKVVQLTTNEYRSTTDTLPVEYKARAVFSQTPGGDYLKGGMLIGHGGFSATLSGSVLTVPQMNVLGNVRLGDNGSLRIQTSTGASGRINIHNISCGPVNWPQPCSTQPVTSLNSYAAFDISGKICAPGQTTLNSELRSLVANCTLPPTAMPIFDKKSFIAGLSGTTIQGSDIIKEGTCFTKSGTVYTGQTYNIPAGAKIIGDINLSNVPKGLNFVKPCKIVFQGDAYITGSISGDLTRSPSTGGRAYTQITVSDSLTKNATIVMNKSMAIVDPDGDFDFVASSTGSNRKIAHIINFNSSNTGCSESVDEPSSTDAGCLTPSEAMDSATNSAYAGLKITSGNNQFNLSGATFYAYYSMIDAQSFRGWSIAALAAQGIANLKVSGDSFTFSFDEPTFGIPVTDAKYVVVDFTQR